MATISDKTIRGNIVELIGGFISCLDAPQLRELGDDLVKLLDGLKTSAESIKNNLNNHEKIGNPDLITITNLVVNLNRKLCAIKLTDDQKAERNTIATALNALNENARGAIKSASGARKPDPIATEFIPGSPLSTTRFWSVNQLKPEVIDEFMLVLDTAAASASAPEKEFTRSLLHFKPDNKSPLPSIPKGTEVKKLVEAWQTTHNHVIAKVKETVKTNPGNRKSIADVLQQRQILLKLKQDLPQCVKEE